ncbi:hypothetical protein GCM10010121_018720 [Streptomyces brasiliensis]|uniref:Uncharacterized protein n=1 Tax=Streptomyces brasiliensis TaxID=1954 RepID=A0A917KCV7_9ACTN|nr:hypothetical protein GCM10010121_018720 [Streptomyces brasiliensis]
MCTISHSQCDSGPKACEMVAAGWSRSGASAAPAQIRAPTRSTGHGIVCPAAAAAAPTPSQAAAPDSECAGPIIAAARPIPRVPLSS